MSAPPTPALYFGSACPSVLQLPHLITALDAELMAKVVHLTQSAPGLWRLPAPYDEADVYDPWRNAETPFSLWNLPANQAELLAPGRFANEALFGTTAILLDSAIYEKAVRALTEVRGERKENGGYYVDGLQDLEAFPRLLEICRWTLMPVAPDRSYGLFVTSPEQASWVEALGEWCDRAGRSRCRLALKDDRLELVEEHAPAEARERAADHAIDQFLGRVERYFRLDDARLIARIEHRIAAARKLARAIAQSKRQDPPRPSGMKP